LTKIQQRGICLLLDEVEVFRMFLVTKDCNVVIKCFKNGRLVRELDFCLLSTKAPVY